MFIIFAYFQFYDFAFFVSLNFQYFRNIEKILLEFGRTGLGGSCLLCGRKRSGKSLVLDQIIKRHIVPSDVRIVNADGEKCSSFAASAKILQKHGLDIGNFDEQKYKKEVVESVSVL